MAIYNYVALKNNKDIVTGKVEAESLRDARDSVRKLGFLPTKVTEENLKKDDQKVDNSPGTMKSLGLQDRIEFTSTLQILAQSGIPIIESLMFIENDAAKLKLRLVSKELRKQIMGGSTFADTVAKYPEIFGQVYIGLVKAGEDSGELEKTLERLMELMNKEANIRGKVIGTLMYPMFVIVLAVFIVLVMLMFVFPVFKDMFDNMGQELPWITATLMKCGIFLKTYWYFVPLIFISIFGGISFIFKWEPSRRKIDENVLKENEMINVFSVLDMEESFQQFVSKYYMIGGFLVVILAFIGIMNFFNTTATSVISRKKELALLEVVGMTKKQVSKMLVTEGFLYLGGAFVIAVLLIVFGAEKILVNTLGTAFFFRLHLTIVPCVLMIPILVGIAYVIPKYQFEKMSRESVVERIRKE